MLSNSFAFGGLNAVVALKRFVRFEPRYHAPHPPLAKPFMHDRRSITSTARRVPRNSHGGGNPLGVVDRCARIRSLKQMQRFAAWTNLVETTFLSATRRTMRASYRVRIFTPTKEIPFAGHPSIGSAHAALDTRFRQGDAMGRLIQQCGAGLVADPYRRFA